MSVTRYLCVLILVFISGSARGQGYRYAVTTDLGSNTLTVVDIDEQVEVASIPTGGRRPSRVAISADATKAYVLHQAQPGGSGNITIVDLGSLAWQSNFAGPIPSAFDIQTSNDGRWLLVSSQLAGRVYRYDLDTPNSPPVTLDLAVNSTVTGEVVIRITDDSQFAFCSVGMTGFIFRIDLNSFQIVSWAPTGSSGVLQPIQMEVVTTSTTPPSYIVCWIRNSGGMFFNAWDVATGQVTFREPKRFGIAHSFVIDAEQMRAAVVGDYSMGAGSLQSATQLWDISGVGVQTFIPSIGSNLPLREVRYANGSFIALKLGVGVQLLDVGNGYVSTEALSTRTPTATSRSAMTLDADRYVFTTSTRSLGILDTVAGKLLAEVNLSGINPQQLKIAECRPARRIEHCNGDGGDQLGCTACPCGNEAPVGAVGGCLNSTLASATLQSSGSLSVSLPPGSTKDLRFQLLGAPPSAFCLLGSGDSLAPTTLSHPCFGSKAGVQSLTLDGLQCVVVNTRRHGGRRADSYGRVGIGTSPWGGEGAPNRGIAVAFGGFTAGQTTHFQVTNRDDPLAICTRGLNTSQAIEITFCP